VPEKFYVAMVASVYKWLIMALFSVSHPFYVSVTEINHNPKDKTLEVSCKMFLDDTEKTLKNQYNIPVELTKPRDPKKTQEMLSTYVKKHFQLKVNGKPVEMEFVGFEVEGASIWTYFQVNKISEVQKLDITDNILYELYDSQISILHAQVKGNKKSTRLSNPETNASFEF
jgi:hypothetical protein